MQRNIVLALCLLLLICFQVSAQTDTLLSKISFDLDFRFRIEQDWDSKKSDGTFRDDRTRLRYRLRTGATYQNDWYSFGFRIRTGDPNKQQDPQLTLGKGLEEFGTLPIGFEKIFFKGEFQNFNFWLGKNTFPFEKNNELFWSDNVYPEGVYVGHNFEIEDKIIQKISLKAGHFILSSNGGSFLGDAYFQGLQTAINIQDELFKFFPSIYFFRNIPNIPDGNHPFELDYTILHFGGRLAPIKNQDLILDFDYYQNIEEYEDNVFIGENLADQKTGFSIGLQYGSLKNPNDWKFKITYTDLEKYAALDYMAQNDWARWDYSFFGSPDGRLTNFKGIELVGGYKINRKINLIAKYYYVNQIIPLGEFKETNQRFRLDLDVKF